MSGDVHPNSGPATKYFCPVCTRNVTCRGVSYKCTRCSGWVHAKCSGILNAAQYRRKSYWTCDTCSAPPSQQSPPPTLSHAPPTERTDQSQHVLQLNTNGIGNKLTFNKHSQYVAKRVSGRNNIFKALAGISWEQQKETLLMTYRAVERSIINYAAPVLSPNLHDTNYRKIQYTQNEALRIVTGCHKMSSIDHLHTEGEMMKVREHSELLSAQYLDRCLEPGKVCQPITTRATPERQIMETLYTRHRNRANGGQK